MRDYSTDKSFVGTKTSITDMQKWIDLEGTKLRVTYTGTPHLDFEISQVEKRVELHIFDVTDIISACDVHGPVVMAIERAVDREDERAINRMRDYEPI